MKKQDLIERKIESKQVEEWYVLLVSHGGASLYVVQVSVWGGFCDFECSNKCTY